MEQRAGFVGYDPDFFALRPRPADWRQSGAVLDSGKFARVAVSEDSVAVFDERGAEVADGEVLGSVLVRDFLGFGDDGVFDLLHTALNVVGFGEDAVGAPEQFTAVGL